MPACPPVGLDACGREKKTHTYTRCTYFCLHSIQLFEAIFSSCKNLRVDPAIPSKSFTSSSSSTLLSSPPPPPTQHNNTPGLFTQRKVLMRTTTPSCREFSYSARAAVHSYSPLYYSGLQKDRQADSHRLTWTYTRTNVHTRLSQATCSNGEKQKEKERGKGASEMVPYHLHSSYIPWALV